jgi:subtilisin family serine protease
MKAHFIIKTSQPIANQPVSWQEAIESKQGATQSFTPEVDALLARHRTPVWVTMEYEPAASNWSEEEMRSGFNRIYRLILQQDGTIPPQLIEDIRLLPQIEYVRSGFIGHAPLPDQQIATASSLTQDYRSKHIYLDEAHRFTTGHPQVTIAVLDTGIEYNHPETAHAMLPGKDFVNILDGAMQFIGDYLDYDDDPGDEVGHGTHVSGILAAKGMKMPVGVAPQCKILPVRVLGALKRGNSVVGAGLIDNINTGIKWAVDNGADVINMSLGIKHEGGGLPHEEVIRYALAKGATIVAASGNDGTNDKYYPGALPGVVAVGAIDENGQVALFSTYGGHVSFTAPGTRIFSTFPPSTYAFSTGTSQAAPFVAGGVALLKSYALKRGRQLSDGQVKYLLRQTTDRTDRQFKSQKAGYGTINLLDALKLLDYKLDG